MAVSDVTAKLAALPLNVTASVPVKLAPLIAILVPSAPLAGVKLANVGAILKAVALVAGPAGVVTLSGPVFAPIGTIA